MILQSSKDPLVQILRFHLYPPEVVFVVILDLSHNDFESIVHFYNRKAGTTIVWVVHT